MDSSKYVYVQHPFLYSFQDAPENNSYSLLIYLAGCEHSCYNCHNSQLQEIPSKEEGLIFIHANTLIKHIELAYAQESMIDSIILSGGDPLFENNFYFTNKFCSEYGKKYKIIVYTGYDIEYVKKKELKGFQYIKCGKYVEGLKEESYKNDYEMQLASRNQEWYDAYYKQISQNGLLKFY
jgi:organic radical activating enzyme